MCVVLLTTDLMLVAAAEGAAAKNNRQLVVASSSHDGIEKAATSTASAVVVDLKCVRTELGGLAEELRRLANNRITICGVAQHVHGHLLDAARAAGFDRVFTRGEFEIKLAALLAESAEPD